MTLNQQERALLQIAVDALSALGNIAQPTPPLRCPKCRSTALNRIDTEGSGTFLICMQCGHEMPADLEPLREGAGDAEVPGP